MAFLAEMPQESLDVAAQIAIAEPYAGERGMANALRVLAIDAAAAASASSQDTSRPGIALEMADVACVLWTRFLKFDAADPHWPDRDRFVLSAGQGALLLYALLHLTGYAGMTLADLQRFRRLHSPAAGHPEHGAHPAIEATTGPAGQGLGQAVGMALAERNLAARFGRSLVDHRVWVLAGEAELMEGVSHEAASLAGQLRLEKLTLLCEEPLSDDRVGDDPRPRFAAQGWAVQRADAHDPNQVASALSFALRSRKPTLIALRGGAAAGLTGAAARAALGWTEPPFFIPEMLRVRWRAAGMRGAAPRRAWLKRMARHPQRVEFERVTSGRLPETMHESLAQMKSAIASARPRLATGQASREILEGLATFLPELLGGAAGPAAEQIEGGALPDGMAAITPGQFAGRFLCYGVREHAMAAAMNGMALHGGVIPFGSSRLAFSDYLRPALRLACLMGRRLVHVMTHDGVGGGEDGPTHQAVEQLAAWRAMPGLHVFRPADAMETAEAWDLALRRVDGPSLLVLGRQVVPALRTDAAENRSARGGYVLAEADGARQATLLASGSEVSVAMSARAALAGEGILVAVVSLPCWELFAQQDAAYRGRVLGGVPRFGIEAAGGFGWERWLGETGAFIGLDGYGASAPCQDLYEHFGLTPEAIVAAVRKRLG